MMKKIILVVLFVSVFVGFWFFGGNQFLQLGYIKSQLGYLQSQVDQNFFQSVSLFFLVYVLSTAFSLPGAALLTLLAGGLFGVVWGVVIVSFASTLGASFAFLSSRLVFRDFFQDKFKSQLKAMNQEILKKGGSYVLTLRLLPIFPFFMVNLVLGLTPISLTHFYLFSQIGMLPGTVIYVNAGTQLSQIETLSGLLSPAIIFSFLLLGIFPFLVRIFTSSLQKRKLYSRFQRPKSFDYNMVVIGAGSAGLVSSYIAAATQAKVALIEREKMGGDCLNTGCVPSKALLRTAKFIQETREAKELGIEQVNVQFKFSEIMARVQEVIRKIEPHDSIERYTSLGVECFKGQAKILSPFEVQVGDRTLTTRNIILATGASPRMLTTPGIEQVQPLTSDNLWSLKSLPEKLIVVGGGPIGCEMAQAFSMLGSKVILIEGSARLMSKEDLDVSNLIEKKFQKLGIQILKQAELIEFRGGKTKSLHLKVMGHAETFEFDEILVAIGRVPRLKGFGLEEIGVEVDQKHQLVVDPFLRTNFPNIFACGDLVGPYQLTHAAAHQAWHASVNALFGQFKRFRVDYRVIPWVTYTSPEVARVGLSEDEAAAQGIPYEVTRYGIDDLDRAIADSNDEGFVKVLTQPGKDEILGVLIVSVSAGEMLQEFVLAMKYGIGLNKILGTIHPYPTMVEANKYSAGVWKKKQTPDWVLSFARKFHAWKRS